METLRQDLRYGLRLLRRSPGFTLIATLTLALGIGANTAMFSVISGVLLRALPFRQPGQLVRIEMHQRATGLRDVGASVPELDDLRRSGLFDEVSGALGADCALSGTDHAARVGLLGVNANYFTMLGAQPELGRVFGPEDDKPGFSETVVLSDGLWRRAFGADPKVLGRVLRLDNDLYTVIGVMPPGFRHPGPTVGSEVEVWGATGFSATPFPPPTRRFRVLSQIIGRLRGGMTAAEAQQRLDALAAALRQQYGTDYPERAGWTMQMVPLQESLVAKSRPLLLVLMGAAGLILLISCVNLANLLLVRATGRQREIAIRAAVGASRARLVRQMLTESVLLSVGAGVLGVGIAAFGMNRLLHAIPANIPRLNEITVGREFLLFGFLVACLTGLVFGTLPALRASRIHLDSVMKEGGRIAGGGHSNRLRASFVTAELALSLVLLVGAGLLLRTFTYLLRVDPGFRPDGVHVASVWIPVPNDPKTDHYATVPQRTVYVREVLRRVRALPGVDAASMTTLLPLSGRSNRITFAVESGVDSTVPIVAEFAGVTPEYFRALGARLIRGRVFDETDDTTRPLVILVDEAAARRFWPQQDAIGKRLLQRFNGPDGKPATRALEVVGVVGDIRNDGLDVDSVPHVYASMYQNNNKVISLVAHTSAGSLDERQVRRELETIDPDLPIFEVTTMGDLYAGSLAERRFAAVGVILFATVAILLAAIGLYGVIGYAVTQRTHELGVRMALGARPSDVLLLVLRDGIKLTALGVAAGLALAFPLARLLHSLIYGVEITDAAVFVAGPVLLAVVGLLAGLIPARRAARIDPMIALRYD